MTYVRVVFNVPDAQLHRDVEAVEEVTAKHERIHRRVNCVAPTYNKVKLNKKLHGKMQRLKKPGFY